MKARCCSKTSVDWQRTTLRYIREESTLRPFMKFSLKEKSVSVWHIPVKSRRCYSEWVVLWIKEFWLITLAIRRRLLTVEVKVQLWVIPCEINNGRICAGADFIQSSFFFPLLIINLPLLHIHSSPPPEVCDSSDQAAHYQIYCIGGFAFNPVFGWLQCRELGCYRTPWKCLLTVKMCSRINNWDWCGFYVADPQYGPMDDFYYYIYGPYDFKVRGKMVKVNIWNPWNPYACI
jgi:hypothetical protein